MLDPNGTYRFRKCQMMMYRGSKGEPMHLSAEHLRTALQIDVMSHHICCYSFSLGCMYTCDQHASCSHTPATAWVRSMQCVAGSNAYQCALTLLLCKLTHLPHRPYLSASHKPMQTILITHAWSLQLRGFHHLTTVGCMCIGILRAGVTCCHMMQHS